MSAITLTLGHKLLTQDEFWSALEAHITSHLLEELLDIELSELCSDGYVSDGDNELDVEDLEDPRIVQFVRIPSGYLHRDERYKLWDYAAEIAVTVTAHYTFETRSWDVLLSAQALHHPGYEHAVEFELITAEEQPTVETGDEPDDRDEFDDTWTSPLEDPEV